MEIVYILAAIIVVANMLLEFKRDLMMLQQNSYRNERYMKWLRTSADTTSAVRLLGMAVFLVSLVAFTSANWAMAIMLLFASICGSLLLRVKYKKPLVWTKRARRLYFVMILLAAIITAAVVALAYAPSVTHISFLVALSATALYCGSHIVTLSANWLLKPVEKNINQKYYDDAARILASMPELKIIGITGSYGKTSTKHYLHRILSEKFDVLMTPGSYNTTLGVIRTVREYLKPYNEVFIVEMGAKQPNDIKEICDLVHPTIGIVTAVGEQHLESFKSIENVQRTKFELIDSLPSSGLAVVNDDFPYVANRDVTNVNCVRYAVTNTNASQFVATDIHYGAWGTSFTVTGPGVQLQLQTRLVGECNISNLLAAVIVALHMGVPHEKIRYAVSKIEQVEHRLNLKRTPGGITIIDDAFNSNPTGSGMALDVLKGMSDGKRIVITPGMIELGDKQAQLNREFGKKIAACTDIAIVVGEYNREAILSGIADGGMQDANVYAVATFNEAQALLGQLVKPGDTVLYENDLPDTFK